MKFLGNQLKRVSSALAAVEYMEDNCSSIEQLCYCYSVMIQPQKKLSFAEEMELLKKQKAHAAELAKQLVAQQKADTIAKRAAQNQSMDASTAAHASALRDSVSSPPAVRATPSALPPMGINDEHQLKIKAMETAFAQHIGAHQPKKSKTENPKEAMLFCTSCLSTTPGEYIKPGHDGVGLALGLIGLIPGIAYFLYQKAASQRHCTHCHATTLVDMNSIQARTLCADKHAELMANGWVEMRTAARDHTMKRRIAIGKILVVAVVVLGAALLMVKRAFCWMPTTTGRHRQRERPIGGVVFWTARWQNSLGIRMLFALQSSSLKRLSIRRPKCLTVAQQHFQLLLANVLLHSIGCT